MALHLRDTHQTFSATLSSHTMIIVGISAFTDGHNRSTPTRPFYLTYLLAGGPDVYTFAIFVLPTIVVVAQRKVPSAAVLQSIACDLRPLHKVL